MPTCGACKLEGQTVEHVRNCYADQRGGVATVAVEGAAARYADNFKPMALLREVPASHYALETPDGLKFYEVRIGRSGTRWDGFRFVDHLVGAPGGWVCYPVRGAARHELLAELLVDPREAAVRYSREFTVCAACGSPLSDADSIARGLGPVCAERF